MSEPLSLYEADQARFPDPRMPFDGWHSIYLNYQSEVLSVNIIMTCVPRQGERIVVLSREGMQLEFEVVRIQYRQLWHVYEMDNRPIAGVFAEVVPVEESEYYAATLDFLNNEKSENDE